MQLKPLTSYDTTPFVSAVDRGSGQGPGRGHGAGGAGHVPVPAELRATLIPAIAVPVVLLGTFGVLAAAGYSINTLTMFAMVLAIGLLVDDAIVVVENVERVMSEEGLSPVEATRKSMARDHAALVGIALVLSAVFIPMAFFRRFHRRYLPAVLHHHRVGHGAVGAGGDDADPGAVRHVAQAHCQGPAQSPWRTPQGHCGLD
jgi:hypothetical protein